MKLKVTNTKTGKTWVDENTSHSWTDLCIYIMKENPDVHLVYCDIECLAKGRALKQQKDGSWKEEEQWYMLDECGRYEPLPDEYVVTEVK